LGHVNLPTINYSLHFGEIVNRQLAVLCLFAIHENALLHHSSLGVSTDANNFSDERDFNTVYQFNDVK